VEAGFPRYDHKQSNQTNIQADDNKGQSKTADEKLQLINL